MNLVSIYYSPIHNKIRTFTVDKEGIYSPEVSSHFVSSGLISALIHFQYEIIGFYYE